MCVTNQLEISTTRSNRDRRVLPLRMGTYTACTLRLNRNEKLRHMTRRRILRTRRQDVLRRTKIRLQDCAVTKCINCIAKLLPAVVRRTLQLIMCNVRSITLFRRTIVVRRPAVNRPNGLNTRNPALPLRKNTRTTLPQYRVNLTCGRLIQLTRLNNSIALLIMPRNVTVN